MKRIAMVTDGTTYRESLRWPLMVWITVLFVVLTLAFLTLSGYQFFAGPIGSRPAPAWYYLIMAILFTAVSVFIHNFSQLDTEVNGRELRVSFGRFEQRIPFEHIEECYIDTANPLLSYGGWGLRFGRVGGLWRRVYNITGCDNLVVRLSQGRIREFVFSTRRPEELKAIIDSHMM